MLQARMAPARVWQRRSTAAYTIIYLYARTRSSCLSPKPETLNPETESRTSGAGPGPGPLYNPPRPNKLASFVMWANLSSLATLRPKTAEPMTLCVPLLAGGIPRPLFQDHHSPAASSVLSSRLPDAHAATGDVHVLCSDGTCARVAASLNRCLYLYARIRSSCLSPKPVTLNPETESGTSGAGPGPGPLYTPPTTRESETEQPHRQV